MRDGLRVSRSTATWGPRAATIRRCDRRWSNCSRPDRTRVQATCSSTIASRVETTEWSCIWRHTLFARIPLGRTRRGFGGDRSNVLRRDDEVIEIDDVLVGATPLGCPTGDEPLQHGRRLRQKHRPQDPAAAPACARATDYPPHVRIIPSTCRRVRGRSRSAANRALVLTRAADRVATRATGSRFCGTGSSVH